MKAVREDTMNSRPYILELATAVAKECGGFPLALITIGRTLACKRSPEEWKYGIQILRRAASEFPGMKTDVFPILKFGSDSLPKDTQLDLVSCAVVYFPRAISLTKRSG